MEFHNNYVNLQSVVMDKIQNYDISFSGLSLGNHTFKMEISQDFFNLFAFEQEFTNPKIDVELLLNKHSSFLELDLKIKGEVNLICDISEEEYAQEVNNELKILVNFGEEYDDSNDEVLVIPIGSHSVNIAQMIYESTVLSVPMKRLNPKYQDENKEDEYLDLLEKYKPKEEDNY